MSVETITEVTWNGTIDITNKIGISDTLDNLSVDLLSDTSVYVTACYNKWTKFKRVTNGIPSASSQTTECPWYLSAGIGYSNTDNNNNSDIYHTSILLAVPSDYNYSNWNTGLGGMLRSNVNNIRVITSLSTEKNNIAVSLVFSGDAVTTPLYKVNENIESTTADGTFTYDGVVYKIICADIYNDGDDYFINVPSSPPFNVFDAGGANNDGVMGAWAYNALTNKMLSLSPQIFEESDKTISIAGSGYYNVNLWTYHATPSESDSVFYLSYSKSGSTWHLDSFANEYYHLLNAARFGLYFTYDNTDYKPVITQGVVIGYTNDLTIESDIDNWTNISGHNISPTPPPPVPPDPDEDNDDPISTVGAPFGTGLAHYYVSTVDSTVLSQISEAMSTWDIDTSKKDLYRNLISCKIMKPPAGIPASPSTFEIYGVKPQYNGADITINEVTGNPSITFGSYSIPRKFNDFRDYAPYSKAEIYIPYCGWTALPSHVIGKSVSVEYFTDVIAGTVKALVYCNNNVVAEAAGVMAVDIPFAAENVGAKVAAATTGLLSYGQGALQASAGIGQAVVSKGKQGTKNIANGLASVIGAYNQMAMTANENWTEINGKSGDGCCLSGISNIIIKITRPKYGNFSAPYYVPDDYAHTTGFVAMKKTTPAECTGLIICDNVDTSGITGATDRERQMIKEYLESGIIVEHPE